MNQLSWFLYLADTLSKIGVFFCVIGGISMVVGFGFGYFFWSLAKACKADDVSTGRPKERIDAWDSWISMWVAFRPFWVAGFIAVCLGFLIPSKQTFYAIAASQIGEQMVKSESVKGITNDATKALQQWIKRQIEPEKEGNK